MAKSCLLDNDVVLKVAAYGLNGPVLEVLTVGGEAPAILGVGRYVIRQKARRKDRFQHPERIIIFVNDFLNCLQVIEPTEQEIELAADFEASALHIGGAFDTGKAQLLAILVKRVSPALVSGDKRAIRAAASLNVPTASNKFVCLEQIVKCLVMRVPINVLCGNICAEPSVDRALSICFTCARPEAADVDINNVSQALQSYISNLRELSADMLMSDEFVSALATEEDGVGRL